MKLAVSNIAWPLALEEQALSILGEASIYGVEIAPTRWWPEWCGATTQGARRARQRFADRGFSIAAMQAIVFGKPECELFGTQAQRQGLKDHLRFCADLAQSLGCRSMVFGAPKNRTLQGFSPENAFDFAREYLSSLAPEFECRGVCLCIEANPRQYGCEFLVDSGEAADLVRSVNSPGVRLHLDTACMNLAQEEVTVGIEQNFDLMEHFHVSQPFLATFDAPETDHSPIAQKLGDLHYAGWVSLEMRESEACLENLTQAAHYLKHAYQGEAS